jgi:hypothetical protein
MAVIRIGTDNLPEPDVVEIFDHKFTIRRVTRSVQKGLEAVDRKLRAADDEEDADKIVALMAEGLDALLAPNGKQTAAKTVLMKLWKDDELSLDQINQLYEGVQESATKRPPTSTPTT